MHRCTYEDRIEIKEGVITRIAQAVWKNKKLDVYQEDENGKALVRNVYNVGMSGYLVSFPGERVSDGYFGTEWVQDNEPWGEVKLLCIGSGFPLYENDERIIITKYPDFKYTLIKLKKITGCVTALLAVKTLRIWKQYKDIELLIGAGYFNLAYNKNVYRMTAKSKQNVLTFLKQQNNKDITLEEIQIRTKYNIDKAEYDAFKRFMSMYNYKCTYPEYTYLQKSGNAHSEGKQLYSDYKIMLKHSTHNPRDKYWRYPKDLRKAHDKLLQEHSSIEALKEKEGLLKKQTCYTKAVKHFFKFKAQLDGYNIFVPDCVLDIKFQADALHQCLISANYIEKVISGRCALVFIRKDGIPVATAEILQGKRIGQFYGDETDRKNCKPSDEVQAVLQKWLTRIDKFMLQKTSA